MKHPSRKIFLLFALLLLAGTAAFMAMTLDSKIRRVQVLEQKLATNTAQLETAYRIMMVRSLERAAMEKRLLATSIQPQWLFDPPPLFIFRSPDVSWTTFLPYIPDGVPDPEKTLANPRAIIGTFPVPPEGEMQDLSGITWDQDTIHLPHAGEYYLYTTLGSFKMLVLPQTQSDEDILDIARFVARNVVHSNAGHARAPIISINAIPAWVGAFFLSDQPLLLWCGAGSQVLNDILNRMGYKTRLMQLLDKD